MSSSQPNKSIVEISSIELRLYEKRKAAANEQAFPQNSSDEFVRPSSYFFLDRSTFSEKSLKASSTAIVKFPFFIPNFSATAFRKRLSTSSESVIENLAKFDKVRRLSCFNDLNITGYPVIPLTSYRIEGYPSTVETQCQNIFVPTASTNTMYSISRRAIESYIPKPTLRCSKQEPVRKERRKSIESAAVRFLDGADFTS